VWMQYQSQSARTCCAVLHVGLYVVKLSAIVNKQPFEELKLSSTLSN